MSTGRHEATRVKTNNRAYGQAERRADFVDELAVHKPGRRASQVSTRKSPITPDNEYVVEQGNG